MPPIQTGKPVGVPLGDFFHRWKEISTDSWILQVVGEGLRLSFSEHPPLVNSPVWTKIPTDVGKARALREEVVALLQKRAIERIFKNSVSGVLFKNFRCTQARWQMETSHRLERSKCVHSGTKVSNGNDKGTQVVNIARRFRREHRLCRRVPACTDTPKLTKIPLLCDRPRRICLHGSSVRPKYQSLGFHKDYGCSSRVLKTIRKSCDIELSRRHSAETPVTRGFSKGDRNPILFYKISRFQGEPREIRAGTITDLCTSRHHVSNTSESSLSDTERIEWTGMFAYICIPTSDLGAKGDSEDCWDEVHGPAYSSHAMVQFLDEHTAGSLRGSSEETAGQSRFPETASAGAVSSRPSVSKSTRLEVVRSALKRKQFSTAALERISAARRPSTLKVYEGKWSISVNWCKQNSLDSLNSSVPQLAEFFLTLSETRRLSPVTIKGYRSMIADTYSR